MATEFDKYAAKANELLNMLAEDLQVPRDKAGRILRAVLHATRNRLSLDESLQVMAQLPMAIKAVYVDQWNPSRPVARIHHVSEFLDEIREIDKGLAGYDFGNNESARRAAEAVFRTLNYYVSNGEFEDMTAVMPKELKDFIRKAIGESRMPL